jgi:hypothetical protein
LVGGWEVTAFDAHDQKLTVAADEVEGLALFWVADAVALSALRAGDKLPRANAIAEGEWGAHEVCIHRANAHFIGFTTCNCKT